MVMRLAEGRLLAVLRSLPLAGPMAEALLGFVRLAPLLLGIGCQLVEG